MGLWTLSSVDGENGCEAKGACLVDSVSGVCFGPLLKDYDHSMRVISYLEQTHGKCIGPWFRYELLSQAAKVTRDLEGTTYHVADYDESD